MSNEKIIDKIKKLLALAESSNPNEALIAAKRARKMMDQHSISKDEIERATSAEYLESESIHQYKQKNSWVIRLQSAVATLNDCTGVIEPKDGKWVHKFRGFTADAVVAKMTLDYLIECCEVQCNNAKLRGRSEKNQFKLGFVRAISIKIVEIMEERKSAFIETTGTDIISLKENSITKHFGDLPSMKPAKIRKPNASEIDAYMGGLDAGKKTGLDKQVHGESIKMISG